ncbi:MAG TPA: DUF1501 domain-containing protein [Gemmataceae bacterium]|jgi:hypothetical protein|nr:DUF1501 domain-containing protein [Gemmataceae bacterium]
MLSIRGGGVRLCDGLSRRELLRIGGLGFTGLLWSDWLRSRALGRTRKVASSSGGFGKAKACIMVFNYGGPSHLETWDLKPDAPKEIRGEFHPIGTNVPGINISEHLPRLAKIANLYTLVRSVTHRDNDHAIGAYLALTGYSHPKNAILGIEPPATAQDLPSLGSVVSKLHPAKGSMFSYVTLGDLRHFGNNDSLGQNAGCLGRAYDPFTVPFVRPMNGELDLSGATRAMAMVDGDVLGQRRQLRAQMDQIAPALERTADVQSLDGFTHRAFELLSSSATRDAFSLAKEPPQVRDFYGPGPFSRNCLLARRLVEAGVPLVTVYSFGNRDWDTHSANFSTLKDTLLPPTDRGLSALLMDLSNRGLLDDTLVVWMSDMGRTPRINREAGRDHWSFCYSILLAGAGIRGGRVYGSSDRAAAYPSTNPVSPADVAATIYHCLGINPQEHFADQQGRPLLVSCGQPLHPLL